MERENPYESPQTKPLPRLSMRRVIANGLMLLALPIGFSLIGTIAEICLPITAQIPGGHAQQHARATLTVAGSALVGLTVGGALFWGGMQLRNSSNQQ